jgi:hypothetical protein
LFIWSSNRQPRCIQRFCGYVLKNLPKNSIFLEPVKKKVKKPLSMIAEMLRWSAIDSRHEQIKDQRVVKFLEQLNGVTRQLVDDWLVSSIKKDKFYKKRQDLKKF